MILIDPQIKLSFSEKEFLELKDRKDFCIEGNCIIQYLEKGTNKLAYARYDLNKKNQLYCLQYIKYTTNGFCHTDSCSKPSYVYISDGFIRMDWDYLGVDTFKVEFRLDEEDFSIFLLEIENVQNQFKNLLMTKFYD